MTTGYGPVYVLDACSLLAYLLGEPKGERVRQLHERANNEPIELRINCINLTEAYYVICRKLGSERADDTIK